MPAPRDVLAARLRKQAAGCEELGSLFYARLLELAAADLMLEGPVWEVLAGHEAEPTTSALPLRFLAAVNRLVLARELPGLARSYPHGGYAGDVAAAWPLFKRALVERRAEVRALVDRPCQTNEVGRSAGLLGGFLEVSRRTRLPLRLLELGASAGLNLRWDRYRYESTTASWGDPASPVHLDDAFTVAPDLAVDASVAVRKGCDLQPVDPLSEDGALTLRAFVWPDQPQRLVRLDGAIRVAAEVPAAVDAIGAADFLERELAAPVTGVATVVYHSVFRQYVTGPEAERMKDSIDRARSFATREAPVSLLTMEPAEQSPAVAFEVRLDGELLGTTHAHGTGVRWLLR
ncbi:MAG TPA: DUF2332 domain-containing protein [Patescibacteria group bacterium]|nr:DUF2332 domain-containing protein [Patescibacteria group bacterium]